MGLGEHSLKLLNFGFGKQSIDFKRKTIGKSPQLEYFLSPASAEEESQGTNWKIEEKFVQSRVMRTLGGSKFQKTKSVARREGGALRALKEYFENSNSHKQDWKVDQIGYLLANPDRVSKPKRSRSS